MPAKSTYKDRNNKKPCLSCDRPMWTSPENRVCAPCKKPETPWQDISCGMDYAAGSFLGRKIYTRNGDDEA